MNPGPDGMTKLRWRDAHGGTQVGSFLIDGPMHLPGSQLTARRLRVAAGDVLVQKYVPNDHADDAALTLLDNEVSATARLWQLFGGPHYPAELPLLVGYDLSAEEPYVLLRGYDGQPLGSVLGTLDRRGQRTLQVNLLTALHHTAMAGIVHGNVRLPVLRYDGSVLRLLDFENATAAGSPLRTRVPDPYVAPEQSAGSGSADPRTDVWAAAMVIRMLEAKDERDGVPRGSFGTRRLLRDVTKPVGSRPSAAQLLNRLDVQDEPVPADVDAHLATGRDQFDQISAAKRGRMAVIHPQPRPSVVKWLVVFGVVLLVLVIVIVVAR